jgi:protein-S-isoprenylcysteine O-methyltransferase Ste14
MRNLPQLAARFRVPAGFVLAAVFLIAARPTPRTLLWGASIALLGLFLRALSAGVVQKNLRLATTGPYAYTRNPLYLGSALAGAGFCVAAGQWWLGIFLIVFFAVVYWPVMRNEESHLRRTFGEDYFTYARAVPLFFPRLTPWRHPGAPLAPFRWRQYFSNREYEALVAFVVIMALLCGKLLWMR